MPSPAMGSLPLRNMHEISKKYSILEKEIKAEGEGRDVRERKAFKFEGCS